MKYFLILCAGILITLGCGKKEANNPLDPYISSPEIGSSFVSTIAFEPGSQEKKDLDQFEYNWQQNGGTAPGDNMDDPNSGKSDTIGDGNSGIGNDCASLTVTINYLNFYGYLEGIYPIYYIGLPMKYEIQIKNNGIKKLNNMEVYAVQEYYENKTCDRWWYPYPETVTVYKGEPMPGDSLQKWTGVSVGAGETLVLVDDFTSPIQTCDGLDQTHIVIKKIENGQVTGAVIYDNPETGVYCPPAPAN